MDKVGQRIEAAGKEYEALVGTRVRQLEKPLLKIDDLRGRQLELSSVDDDADRRSRSRRSRGSGRRAARPTDGASPSSGRRDGRRDRGVTAVSRESREQLGRDRAVEARPRTGRRVETRRGRPPGCTRGELESLDDRDRRRARPRRRPPRTAAAGRRRPDAGDEPQLDRCRGTTPDRSASGRDQRGRRARRAHLDEQVTRRGGEDLGQVDDARPERRHRRSRARSRRGGAPSRTHGTTSRSGRSASASPVVSGHPSTAIGSSCGKGSERRRGVPRCDRGSRRSMASRAAGTGSGAATTRAQSHHSGPHAGWCASSRRHTVTSCVGSGPKSAEAVGRLEDEVGVVARVACQRAQPLEGEHRPQTGACWSLLARVAPSARPRHALADDVAHDLVGAAGDAPAGDAEHELRPGVGAPLAAVGDEARSEHRRRASPRCAACSACSRACAIDISGPGAGRP